MADTQTARLTELVYRAEKIEEITDGYVLKYLKTGHAVSHRPPLVYDLKFYRPLRDWSEIVVEETHTVIMLNHTVIESRLLRWYLALNDATRKLRKCGDWNNEYIPAKAIDHWSWRPGLFVGYCDKCNLLQWAHGEPMIKPIFPINYWPSQNQLNMMVNSGHGDMRLYL